MIARVSICAIAASFGLMAAAMPASAETPRRTPRPSPAELMLPCPEYGPGFVRAPGGATCVRVGGQIRGEAVMRDRRSRLDGGLNAQARMTVDSRTETGLGTFRAVMSLKGQTGSPGTFTQR